MKNLYLISTEKPSKLSILNSGKLNLGAEIMSSSNSKPQHIYITNDVEIKVGDWVYNEYQKIVLKFVAGSGIGLCQKIILTTDQDLIADGVQAIDDDFLQWFIKNSSCEFVEVKEKQHFEADKSKRINPLNGVYYSYKIIIHKEEPKQETVVNEKCFKCGNSQYKIGTPFCTDEFCNKYFYQEPKQESHICKHCGVETTQSDDECYAKPETLEENTKRPLYFELVDKKAESNNTIDLDSYAKGVQDGVIWQAERMYSEEDMINFAFDTYYYISKLMEVPFNQISENKLHAIENLKQFKKK
jgi:hypothetical protein